MEYKFGGKYLLEEEIANGGCGTVYLGTHHIAGKPVAIKLEPAAVPEYASSQTPSHMRKSKSNPNIRPNKTPAKGDALRVYPGPSPLTLESQIYKRLCGAPGVPFLLHSGKAGPYNVLILDLLGSSLDDLFKLCNRSFSIKTICLLADQLLDRIEFIHSRGLVHRDIKPANFVMGRSSGPQNPRSPWKHVSGEAMVNVIDFGLAKKFRDAKGCHIPYNQQDCHGVGTSLFASLNTHLGVESSRRDDLESLAYMLIYFMRGTLPWRRIRAPSKKPDNWTDAEEYNPISVTWNLIRDAKLKNEETLCHGLPPEMDVLYRYARSLAFDDLPDYAGLRDLFRGLAARAGVKYPEDYDGVFDWTVPPPTNHPRRSSSSSVDVRPLHGEGGGRFCEACQLKRHARESENSRRKR